MIRGRVKTEKCACLQFTSYFYSLFSLFSHACSWHICLDLSPFLALMPLNKQCVKTYFFFPWSQFSHIYFLYPYTELVFPILLRLFQSFIISSMGLHEILRPKSCVPPCIGSGCEGAPFASAALPVLCFALVTPQCFGYC